MSLVATTCVESSVCVCVCVCVCIWFFLSLVFILSLSNVKCKTIKLLEGNIGESLGDLEFANNILDRIPKAQSMKEGIYKPDFIQV